MSFVSTQPTELTAAAENVQGIGSSLVAQNLAAAAPTTGVLPAAADEVSALTAAPRSWPADGRGHRGVRPGCRHGTASIAGSRKGPPLARAGDLCVCGDQSLTQDYSSNLS